MIVLCTREAVMGGKRSGETGKSEGLGDKLNILWVEEDIWCQELLLYPLAHTSE